MPARRFWTPRRDAALGRLVARKLLTAEIARRLSRPGEPVTAYAVSRRVHVLGLRLPRGRPRLRRTRGRSALGRVRP
jgi:hypothetical protein